MPKKEWTAQAAGHDIRVVNSWTGGTRLYINGDCRDRNHGLFALTWSRWLSARLIPNDANSDLIEVYVVALINIKAQIRINGQYFAGDKEHSGDG